MVKKESESLQSNDNSFGVSSLNMAMLSVVFSLFLSPIAGFICGIIGGIFGWMQIKRSKNNWAVLGLVISILGIIASIITFILVMYYVPLTGEFA